ncbi:MAG: hypothetical protein CVU56_01075 [Deltaproteobacteria bacterium HGW-Deltaproteobacteria-14]|jgi:flavin reductase (DIM6/NTAB) family NADH-FMN oxidoreductase RutF|nr:MAG: hypothetical protein CVU56_01075 [Deltaproteobacteria bacterium HGW-Deltaproteobacteria-14]
MSQPLSPASGGGPFVDVPLRERFFQSSAFFPMPIVLASTRGPDGATNLAPYSLCFPHVSGDGHAMVLVTKRASKTAANLIRSGTIAINFIPDEAAYLANCKVLSRVVPTAEKMAQSVFTLAPSARAAVGGEAPPDVVAEAVQVFECALDRVEPSEVGEAEHRFILRVERILMQPRWHAALEAGRGCPRLPVDYGFRQATDSWLSRPRVDVSGPRLRPRFEISVPRPPEDVGAAFGEALSRPDATVVGARVGEHIQLSLPEDRRTTWSPHLDLRLEADDAGGTKVRGRIGPHPHVWTLFTALHLAVAFSAIGGLMWGLSQLMANESAFALWAVPIALFLHAFIAGAAFIGQGLGADQTYQLRTFLDDVLGV